MRISAVANGSILLGNLISRGDRLPSALLIGVLALCAVRLMMADDSNPTRPPASSYAPAEDLINQVDFYIGRIEETLAKKEDFDDAAKSRLKKDANTLAALVSVLLTHDSESRFSHKDDLYGAYYRSARLAVAADYDAAIDEFTILKKTLTVEDGTSPGGVKPNELRTVSVAQVMKQVPSINAALKRGVNGDAERFQKLKQQSAGQSATLAAIAQTIQYNDRGHGINLSNQKLWHQDCAEMRDAAGAVNKAIHADDQPAAITGMTRLAKSCETCHAVFRKDKN